MLELLEMLKIDKSISTTAFDERLLQYLEGARAEIVRMGYTFSDPLTVAEMQIIVSLAGFKWENRAEPNMVHAMPRHIEWEVHCMVLGQKARG